MKLSERYNSSVHELIPLHVGDAVALQTRQKRWMRVGRVVEVLKDRQYRIRMEGSGRVTLRNRRFIKKIHPSLIKPTPYPSPLNAGAPIFMSHSAVEISSPPPAQSPVAEPSVTQANGTPKIPMALKRLNQFNNNGKLDNSPPTHRLRGGRGDVELLY